MLLIRVLIIVFSFFTCIAAQSLQPKERLADIVNRTNELQQDIDYLSDVSLSLLQRSMDDQEGFIIYITSLKNADVFISMNKTVSILILYNMLDADTKLQAKELYMSVLKIIQENISGSLQDFYALKPNIKETTTIMDRVDRIIRNYSEIEFHVKTLYSSMN